MLDNSRYYILGYHSDSSRWSRKFLTIEVRVKRPGLKVRARRGFMPPDPRAAEKARDGGGRGRHLAGAGGGSQEPVPIGQLPMRVFAAPFKAAGKNSSVLLALEIDGQALKFEPRDGRFSEKLEISIVATDQKAKVQGGDRQQFDLNLMPQTYERVSRSGVRLMSRLELPPGRYQFRVGAHESTGGLMATVPYDLEVPDFSTDAARHERDPDYVVRSQCDGDTEPGSRAEGRAPRSACREAQVWPRGDADVFRGDLQRLERDRPYAGGRDHRPECAGWAHCLSDPGRSRSRRPRPLCGPTALPPRYP